MGQFSPPPREVKPFETVKANLAQEVKPFNVSGTQRKGNPTQEAKAFNSLTTLPRGNPMQEAKAFNSLKTQPKAEPEYSAAHSRGLMSSLLQQESQVDMQEELRALAADLGSVEATSCEMPVRPDVMPAKQRKDSNAQKKNAQQRSKSVSYLITKEDVDNVKAKKSKTPKDLRNEILREQSIIIETSPATNTPMKFRAAPEVQEEAKPVLSESPEVLLHIYEVGELSPGIQKMLTTVLGRSALHVGVEIFGEEWSFGSTSAPNSKSGIQSSRFPKMHLCHRYKETLSLGSTQMSFHQVRTLLNELDSDWLANEYHPLRRNCVNFAEELCQRLGVEQPPSYIGALSRGLKNFLLV